MLAGKRSSAEKRLNQRLRQKLILAKILNFVKKIYIFSILVVGPSRCSEYLPHKISLIRSRPLGHYYW